MGRRSSAPAAPKSRAKSKGLPGGKLIGAALAAVIAFVLLSTAPNWAPQEDWQLPGIAITLTVGVALLVLFGLEMRGLVIAGVIGLVVGFLSVNEGPLQPGVFSAYGQVSKLTTGHPLCEEGKTLNKAKTACVKAATPAKKKVHK